MEGPGKLADVVNPSRRRFLAAALGAFAIPQLLLSGCGANNRARRSERELHIYSWADYLHPDTIPEFERRHHIKVIYDTFASNEALLAKMQAGASDYDIIVPTSYMVKHLLKLNLLAPIDHARLPHFDNIMPRFRDRNFDPQCGHSVPYTWGTTGIAFNKSAFAGRSLPDDWDVLWDRHLSGRITLLDDARETIGMALKRRGYSYNTTAEGPLNEATSDLIAEKSLVMSYTSDQAMVQLASGDCLASLVYSGDAFQAARENPNVNYIVPRSGCSYWTDNLCIPRTAPNPDNAYLWINYILEPEVSAAIANYTRYATPNSQALKLITPDLLQNKNLYPSESTMSKCEEVADVGRAIFLYDRLWTELKCA